MDDWQETQLTTRHMHNRTGTRNNQRGSKPNSNSASTFDVARTFGTYDVKCPAADRLSGPGSMSDSTPWKSKVKGKGGSKAAAKADLKAQSMSTLEIYTLNEGRNAIVGEISLGGGVVRATVILAGSRKTMEGVIRGFEKEQRPGSETSRDADGDGGKINEDGEAIGKRDSEIGSEEDDDEKDRESEADENDDEDEEESSDEDESNDNSTDKRVQTFEKNSFRSPKFWVRWQGQVPCPVPDPATSDTRPIPDGVEVQSQTQTVTDTGYIVFSGNQCDRFQGTISCESLGWKNVKMSGWKVKSQSARDFTVNWDAT